jgi:hypothetical protein
MTAGLPSRAFNKALTTTWIWNVHASAHEFSGEQPWLTTTSGLRQVFSVNIAHLGVVFAWKGGMIFHSAYIGNYCWWWGQERHCWASAQQVTGIVGQEILNSDLGGYFSGLLSTSGLFNVMAGQGLTAGQCCKLASVSALLGLIWSCASSFIHVHLCWFSATLFSKGLSQVVHHAWYFGALAVGAWCGHSIHVSFPSTTTFGGGVDLSLLP